MKPSGRGSDEGQLIIMIITNRIVSKVGPYQSAHRQCKGLADPPPNLEASWWEIALDVEESLESSCISEYCRLLHCPDVGVRSDPNKHG
ncbi:hypothetical protein NDU88_010000 [Pleurodeles waltl]|uniref:Uncharacterized protein n=1 Tax=Pleurodeles waltl TaxID=8319 RepID=A0AAV7S0L6_PLEWA|nr:hypothetical protein NDU88_010000 [Pleurodeles waltl]